MSLLNTPEKAHLEDFEIMPNITVFNTSAHHIHFIAYIMDNAGKKSKLRAVLLKASIMKTKEA